MRRISRFLAAPVLMALVLAASATVVLHARTNAYTARVIMYDNDGQFNFVDPGTGEWTFAPSHVEVAQGEPIVFENPASNKRPHAVVSIAAGGTPFDRTLTSGSLFNSSPTAADLIMPGNSWTLDTSSLEPAHYTYFCSLHPWMVGSFTVTEP